MTRLVLSSLVVVPSLLLGQAASKMTPAFWKSLGEAYDLNRRNEWPVLESYQPVLERDLISDGIIASLNSPNNYDNLDFRQYLRTHSHFKHIPLSTDRTEQILVLDDWTCGVYGCTISVFSRSSGRLRPVLQMFGTTLFIQRKLSLGFHDVAVYGGSIASGEFLLYRWNGAEYKLSGCMSQIKEDVVEKKCGAEK